MYVLTLQLFLHLDYIYHLTLKLLSLILRL